MIAIVRTNPIKFGTDGWRAVIAEEFTFENVRYCAQGVADYLIKNKMAQRGIIIGYDMRFASEDFAAASAEVLAGNGIKVYLTDAATPTPVISFGVLAKKAAGAIIITASHNPGEYNGFKYKDENGWSASDAETDIMIGFINKSYETGKVNRMPLAEAIKKKLVLMTDLAPIYFKQISKLVDITALKKANLNIVIDPLYGAGAGYLKKILEGGSLKLLEIHGQRNPIFPGLHPEPIPPHLNELVEAVKKNKANVGLATDGDADRMGIIDEKGDFVTQLQVFALLCLYFLETRGERGAIIKTLTTTNMANILGKLYNVPVFQTPVGFKYIAPLMKSENAIIGGEESGGYGFRGHVLERDGILGNLFFLDFMVKTGKNPSELLKYLYSKVGPHHYARVDIKFPAEERETIIKRVRSYPEKTIDGTKVLKLDTTDGYRFVLEDDSWLLIRFSGTEPLLRIYCETNTPKRALRLLEIGKKIAGV